MKKFKFLVILMLFLTLNVYASTNTEVRTKDDLKVWDDIKVTKYNIDYILDTPKVNEKEKVYDFADLFTDSEEEALYQKIISFNSDTNYDLAVVTINDNNKYSSSKYADDFYDYNYFGFDSSYSGLLMLIDMDNRMIEISTSGYAIKMYDDYRIDAIIDTGYNELKNGLYAKSISNMIDKSLTYYNSGFPVSNEHLIINGTDVENYNDKLVLSELVSYCFVISVIITTIVAIVMYHKTSLKIKNTNIINYLINEKNVQFNERYIRTTVRKVPRNTGSSSSGGSSRSGSSIRTGSSGRSHGGGGRRF